MYEVTLAIESNINDAHNPVFYFDSWDCAMQLVETFTAHGYVAAIAKTGDE